MSRLCVVCERRHNKRIRKKHEDRLQRYWRNWITTRTPTLIHREAFPTPIVVKAGESITMTYEWHVREYQVEALETGGQWRYWPVVTDATSEPAATTEGEVRQ